MLLGSMRTDTHTHTLSTRTYTYTHTHSRTHSRKHTHGHVVKDTVTHLLAMTQKEALGCATTS